MFYVFYLQINIFNIYDFIICPMLCYSNGIDKNV